MCVASVVGNRTDQMSGAGWRTDEVLHRGFLNSDCGNGYVDLPPVSQAVRLFAPYMVASVP